LSDKRVYPEISKNLRTGGLLSAKPAFIVSIGAGASTSLVAANSNQDTIMGRTSPGLLSSAFFVLAVSAGAMVDAADKSPAAGKYALLVGCTHYDNLGEAFQLKGPANDVLLMRNLLIERFGFPKEAITVLSEAAGGENRPTKAHIERELHRLAQLAGARTQVVIFLAGHGSKAPGASAPQDAPGLRMHQIYLPADVGKWDGSKSEVRNAVTDDEFHAWVGDIRNTGANLWVIVDACHSGGMIRGAGEEVVRQIPSEALIPPHVMREVESQARARGERGRGRAEEDPGLKLADEEPGMVALFAAQSSEVTVEKSLPAESKNGRRYGLFTYTICQALTQAAAPMTYAELIQRVQSQYVGWGRTFPTPLVQGRGRDREVLGARDWPGRSRIILSADEDGLKINAGAIQALGLNTILAVYPPAGQPRGAQPLGYVKIVDRQTLTSQVEPCDYQKIHSDRSRLPLGGVCEPVVIDIGDLRLRVAVDPQDNRGGTVPESDQARLRGFLREISSDAESPLVSVADPRRAQWLVRWDAGKVYLLPAEGVLAAASGELPRLYGPAPAGEAEKEWLRQRLTQIARVRNLQQIASSSDDAVRGDAALRVGLELRLLKNKNDREGQSVSSTTQPTFYDGDSILFRVTNPNRFPIDLTLLYIDGGLGIDLLFPERGEINRLDPGEIKPFRVRITAERTSGLEHLVIVAVKGTGGPPVDFSILALPTLEEARIAERTRGVNRGADSSLGQMLRHALLTGGSTRGATSGGLDEFRLDLRSWKVVPKNRDGLSAAK
jgi:hypothetical protein